MSLVLQDKYNIEIFLSPDLLQYLPTSGLQIWLSDENAEVIYEGLDGGV